MKILGVIAIAVILSLYFGNREDSSYSSDTSASISQAASVGGANYVYNDSSSYDYRATDEYGNELIDRDAAVDDHWDEIKEYLNTSDTVDAYSYDSGNTYSLDADISNGEVDTIYFPNDGYVSIGSNIDSSGEASGLDYQGREWDINYDMDSSAVDDAIQEWAEDNGYEIE